MYYVDNDKYQELESARKIAIGRVKANEKAYTYEYVSMNIDATGSCTIANGKKFVVIYKRNN